MKSKRSRLALVGVLALAVSVTVGLTVSGTAAAKKKKKAGGTVDITKAVNQQVPDATATTNGVLVSTIDVGGKKFKGTKVRDVNVTLQATGSAGDAADDLTVRLTAPNGATTWLFGNELVGQSFGPFAMLDEVRHHPRPLAHEGPHDLAPDAARGAGYQHNAVGQVCIHDRELDG